MKVKGTKDGKIVIDRRVWEITGGGTIDQKVEKQIADENIKNRNSLAGREMG